MDYFEDLVTTYDDIVGLADVRVPDSLSPPTNYCANAITSCWIEPTSDKIQVGNKGVKFQVNMAMNTAAYTVQFYYKCMNGF